jgi:hypothetical protein
MNKDIEKFYQLQEQCQQLTRFKKLFITSVAAYMLGVGQPKKTSPPSLIGRPKCPVIAHFVQRTCAKILKSFVPASTLLQHTILA